MSTSDSAAPLPPPPKKGRLSSEFNSWVIGGSYSKNTLKKQQIRADLEMKKKMENEEVDDYYQQRIAKRREELREAKAAAIVTYKSKVTAALREHPTRSTRTGSESPKRSPRRPHTVDEEADDGTSSKALRERLKVSFAQTTAAHAYGTLFPPLLTPYNRPLSTKADRPGSPPKTADTGLDAQKTIGAMNPRDSFSAVANSRQRVQPVSGPKAFFPTGSATTAYRCLTHAVPMTRAKELRASQLSDVMSSSPTGKRRE